MISPQDNKRPLIIPDFRPPSYIRLGIAPLYVSYEEIFQAVLRIKEIIETEEFLLFNTEIEGVS
jgi:kynureninase